MEDTNVKRDATIVDFTCGMEEDPETSFITFNMDVSHLISTLQAPDGFGTPISERTSRDILRIWSDDLQGRLDKYNRDRLDAGEPSNNLMFRGTGVYVVLRDPNNTAYGLTGILTCRHVYDSMYGANPVVFLSESFNNRKELPKNKCILGNGSINKNPSYRTDALKDSYLDYAFFPCELQDESFLEVQRNVKKDDKIAIRILANDLTGLTELTGDDDEPTKITGMSKETITHDIETIVGLSGSPIVSREFHEGNVRVPSKLIAIHSGGTEEPFPGFVSERQKRMFWFGFGSKAEAIENDIIEKVKEGSFGGEWELKCVKKQPETIAASRLFLVCAGSDIFQTCKVFEERLNNTNHQIHLINKKVENCQEVLTRTINDIEENIILRVSKLLNSVNQMDGTVALPNSTSNTPVESSRSNSSRSESIRIDSNSSTSAYESLDGTGSAINAVASLFLGENRNSLSSSEPMSTVVGNTAWVDNNTLNPTPVLGEGEAVGDTRHDVTLEEWRSQSNLPLETVDIMYQLLSPSQRVKFLEQSLAVNTPDLSVAV